MAAFLDTNVLVYAFDKTSPRKQEVALRLVGDESPRHVLSAQVLNEFYATVTRKIPEPLDVDTAKEAVRLVSRRTVLALNATSTLDAIEIASRNSISHWDGLIIEAAQRAGCSVLYTEDLQHGQRFGDLEVVDPFR